MLLGYCLGASSNLASWNEVALGNYSSTHGSAAVASTLLYPQNKDEILESVSVKAFTFNELKVATQNFRPDTLLGEGVLWSTFKGWVDMNTHAPTKPGTGMPVAVKKLNQEDYMDHREWLVSSHHSICQIIPVYVTFTLCNVTCNSRSFGCTG